jgi:hypothetical protein
MFRTSRQNLRRCSILLVASLCLNHAVLAQSPPKVAPDTDLPLPAEQTARATGMLPLFDRIRELSSASSSENRWELFFLRQQALMEVTSASLEVDAATGQIDVEIAETRELQNYLTAHRDIQVGRLNLVSIAIGGTAGTTSSALGLTTHARIIPKGFPKSVGRVGSRLYGFPCSVISMACFRGADQNATFPKSLFRRSSRRPVIVGSLPTDTEGSLPSRGCLLRSDLRLGDNPTGTRKNSLLHGSMSALP